MNASEPVSVRLSLDAMATRFELLLYGEDEIRLRAAGEEALREIERLDAQLSLYRADSELSWINARASQGPVKVEPGLFELLQRAAKVSQETDGAFDVTVAPLMRAWGFTGGWGSIPDSSQIEEALALVGMRHIELSAADLTVQFDRPGVEIDLGAIGKGCAIERAVELLREGGVTSGLIHGGTSTVYGMGTPPEESAWKVAIRGLPLSDSVELHDSALSVSAVHGKSFSDGSREYGHVIDPRTGQPVEDTLLAAVTGPCPTECDALSTALLVSGRSWIPTLETRFPGYSGMAVTRSCR